MNNNNYERDDSQHNDVSLKGASGAKGATSKPYQKPVLIAYGDVRDVTLGPTLGGGESGNSNTRCDRGNSPPQCIT